MMPAYSAIFATLPCAAATAFHVRLIHPNTENCHAPRKGRFLFQHNLGGHEGRLWPSREKEKEIKISIGGIEYECLLIPTARVVDVDFRLCLEGHPRVKRLMEKVRRGEI